MVQDQSDVKESPSSFQTLESVLQSIHGKRLLTVCRGAPDPDFLGSAVALELLASRYQIEVAHIATDQVGDDQNREIIKQLDFELHVNPSQSFIKGYDAFAVLDAHGIEPCMIKKIDGLDWVALIDHHDPVFNGRQPRFVDVRENVGATCTIFAQYLQDGSILDASKPRHVKVATALDIGIRIDTSDCRRATAEDFGALKYLAGFNSKDLLNSLLYQTTSAWEMDSILDIWQHKENVGGYVLASTSNPVPLDQSVFLAKSAERMIRIIGIDTALVYARIGEKVQGSFRTCAKDVRPTEFLERMFPDLRKYGGGCGGHAKMGGFSFPLTALGDISGEGFLAGLGPQEHLDSFMRNRFYTALGKTPSKR